MVIVVRIFRVKNMGLYINMRPSFWMAFLIFIQLNAEGFKYLVIHI